VVLDNEQLHRLTVVLGVEPGGEPGGGVKVKLHVWLLKPYSSGLGKTTSCSAWSRLLRLAAEAP
jgi:hypothetical protein